MPLSKVCLVLAHAFWQWVIIIRCSSWLQVCHQPQESMLGSGSLSATSASHAYASPAPCTLGEKRGAPLKSWGRVNASDRPAEVPAAVRRRGCVPLENCRASLQGDIWGDDCQLSWYTGDGAKGRGCVLNNRPISKMEKRENGRINFGVPWRQFTPVTTETIKGDSGLVCVQLLSWGLKENQWHSTAWQLFS